MKPLTKEELDGCYIHYDEYAIACLIKIGLIRAIINNKAKYIKMSDVSFMEDNNKDWVDYEAKLIYFHKGNFYAEPYQEEEDELTYGETIKQPFPKLEDIEWVMVEAPKWLRRQMNNSFYADIEIGTKQPHLTVKHLGLQKRQYDKAKEIHENSQDFKVTWQLKQTDPHADIRAEYEKAIADGKIVKMFCNCFQTTKPSWSKDSTYQLRYYEIDWNKLLSWSYANGEFIGVMLDDNSDFRREYKTELRGFEGDGNFLDEWGSAYKYCRLAKGVEIKDEWIEEIK